MITSEPDARPASRPLVLLRRWRRWRRSVLRTLRAMAAMDTSMRCAGVAFFGFISIFPAIGIAVFLTGLLVDRLVLLDLVDRAGALLPEIVLNLLAGQVEAIVNQRPAALGVGLLISVTVALWSGSRGVAALLHATSRTRRKPKQRSFLTELLVAIVGTIVTTVALLVALALVAALPAYLRATPFLSFDERLVLWARWPLLLLLATGALGVLYHASPDHPAQHRRWVWPGAIVAAVLWIAACVLFSLYVENFSNFEAVFGSVTAALVLLLWLYNSALIFVFGAALNSELEYESFLSRAAQQPASP